MAITTAYPVGSGTTPPENFPVAPFAYQGAGNPSRFGPYFFGGALYGVGINGPASSQSVGMVFKSTDAGLTWIEQDTPNRPEPSDIGDKASIVAYYKSPADGDGKIYILYKNTGVGFLVTTFDCSSDTYTSTSDPDAAPDDSIHAGIQLLVTSTGDFLHLWVSDASKDMFLSRYASGVWNSPVLIVPATGFSPFELSVNGASIDSSDRVHVFFTNYTTSAGNFIPEVDYIQISAGDSPGSPVFLQTGPTGNENPTSGAVPALEADAITFPFGFDLTVNHDGLTPSVYAARGTSLASPSWTITRIDTGAGALPSASNQAPLPTAAVDGSGNPVVNYVILSARRAPLSLSQIWQTTFSGSWGTPVLLFDSIATPPLDQIPGDSPYTQASTGSFGFNGADPSYIYNFISPLMAHAALFSFSPSAPPTAPTIACPTGSGTAIKGSLFTSNPPVVTGGTGPFTYALLSGPAWMSIDTATGVVSGVPDATGTVTYVIQVTDSLGNVTTTDPGCSVVVSKRPCPPQFLPGQPTTATSAGDHTGSIVLPKFMPGKGGNRFGNN